MTKESNNILKKRIEAIENYESEKAEIADRIKEIFAVAKAEGFSPKIMKKIIKIRKTPKEDLEEEKYLLECYADSLQMDLFDKNIEKAVNNFAETVKDLEKKDIKVTLSKKEERKDPQEELAK